MSIIQKCVKRYWQLEGSSQTLSLAATRAHVLLSLKPWSLLWNPKFPMKLPVCQALKWKHLLNIGFFTISQFRGESNVPAFTISLCGSSWISFFFSFFGPILCSFLPLCTVLLGIPSHPFLGMPINRKRNQRREN